MSLLKLAATIELLLACQMGVPLANAQAPYTLKPTPKTVAWGYYDAKATPVLPVKSEVTPEEFDALVKSEDMTTHDAPFNVTVELMKAKRKLWTGANFLLSLLCSGVSQQCRHQE